MYMHTTSGREGGGGGREREHDRQLKGGDIIVHDHTSCSPQNKLTKRNKFYSTVTSVFSSWCHVVCVPKLTSEVSLPQAIHLLRDVVKFCAHAYLVSDRPVLPHENPACVLPFLNQHRSDTMPVSFLWLCFAVFRLIMTHQYDWEVYILFLWCRFEFLNALPPKTHSVWS